MGDEEEKRKCNIEEINHDINKQVGGRPINFSEADNNQKTLVWKPFNIHEGKSHISKHTKGSILTTCR